MYNDRTLLYGDWETARFSQICILKIVSLYWSRNESRNWNSAVRFDGKVEKLCYFVEQMDIRNKTPHLFHAFGFRPLVEKCSLRATKSYICIYMCRIDPFLLDRSSLCIFFVCDPYVVPRSLISNPIANGIIDWMRHTEKRVVTYEYSFLFPIFLRDFTR